uniref:DUF7083 domain-containing protein n=1 Tax=Caenorhabditis japonica TaxID=281687 RepID=A0A8R1I3A8_CAEJA
MDAQQLKLVMDMQRKANLERMEQISRMFVQLLPTNGQPSPAAPTAESRNVSIMDSLSARLPTFTYDKENQCTFDSWYSRYEDLIEKEGNELDDASKARLVLLKLDGQSYALFTNIILPKKPADLNLEEGPILSGSRIFGSQTLWVRWIFGYGYSLGTNFGYGIFGYDCSLGTATLWVPNLGTVSLGTMDLWVRYLWVRWIFGYGIFGYDGSLGTTTLWILNLSTVSLSTIALRPMCAEFECGFVP